MRYYRPKFKYDASRWEQLINYIREIGIDEAFARLIPSGGQVRKIEKSDSVAYEYKGEQPITSLDEAIRFFEVDTDKWEVDKWVSNAWDVTLKDQSGNDVKRTNYQVKLWLRAKSVDWSAFKASLAQSIEPVSVSTPGPRKTAKKAVEIHVTDLHIGKVGFDVETLQHNWTVDEAAAVYRAVIDDVLSKVSPDEIAHFILPTGGDLLNINSAKNQTVAGTPQMAAQFFQNLFLFTRRMVSDTIKRLAEVAPVYVYIVPGNHDGEAVFSMGEALAAQFEGNEHVHIDNTPILRKYHVFGANMIGFAHGDKINARDWHNAMSNDRPREFGEAKYRFFHVGHLHKNMKKRRIDLTLKDEHHGVEVEICPSLSPTDIWHYQNLFVGNMRRSKTFVYDKDKGKIMEFYFNI